MPGPGLCAATERVAAIIAKVARMLKRDAMLCAMRVLSTCFTGCSDDDTTRERQASRGCGERCRGKMVGTTRFELATSPTPRVRSTRLSHVPTCLEVVRSSCG